MLKKLALVTIVSLAFSTIAQADTILGIEVGTYQWSPDYTGNISVDGSSQDGDSLSLVNDLGFSDGNHNVTWASLEHPVPFLPNVKIVTTDLDISASSILNKNITFGGQIYSINENVTTQVDLSNTEYTLYYELLDNWINLDAGVTFRQYDGITSLKTDPTGSNISESEALDFIFPLLYLKGRFDLPLTGFFVDGEVNILSYDGDSISDTAISVGYESDIGLGGKAGYRTFSMDINESDFTSDIEFKGAYVSVFYHF